MRSGRLQLGDGCLSSRRLVAFAAAAAATAVVLLMSACTSGHPSSAGSSTQVSASYQAELAYAKCMRSHGLPGYPEPTRGAGGDAGPAPGAPANPPADSPAGKAIAACKGLLRRSGTGTAASPATSAPAVATDCLVASQCYTPQQLQTAYGIAPLLSRGVTGSGQTIVLPEFPPAATGSSPAPGQVPAASDLRQDVAAFDSEFHLPAAQLQVDDSLAHVAAPWQAGIEEVEDTEIAHAVAPGAALREVLIPSADTASTSAVTAAVVAALNLGRTEGTVISLSAGAGEQCFTAAEAARVHAALAAAQGAHVTVVMSTGDSGAATTACPPALGSATVKGVDLPASDPLVLSVGGTSLRAERPSGGYRSESAWNLPASAGGPRAGGGGFSRLIARPSYQDGVAGIGATRGVPDVAADADPRTGLALVIAGSGAQKLHVGAGGTSAGAPFWAGVVALADQQAGHPLGDIDPALYAIARGAHGATAFHDVTSGGNSMALGGTTIAGYQARRGWDAVTGWGTPDVQVLVPLLAAGG